MEEKLGIQERRNSTRVAVAVPASYIRFDSKGWVCQLATCRSMDMGSGGVRLKSSFSVDVKEMLQVTMAFRSKVLTFRGQVVHVAPLKNESLEFGVKIREIMQEDRIALSRFLIRKSRETRFEDRVFHH